MVRSSTEHGGTDGGVGVDALFLSDLEPEASLS